MLLDDISLRNKQGKKQVLRIIYEDSDLVVIDKPPGVPVVPDHWDTEKINVYGLLTSQLQKGLSSPEEKIWVVHRIDQDTSGLVVFAKNREAHSLLNRSFSKGKVQKSYLAIVRGCPDELEGRIEFSLSSPKKGRVVVDPDGKQSITLYRVVEKFSRYSILEVNPLTGRTHQIRVHLQAIGHPLLVDPLYSGKNKFYITDVKRYARIQVEGATALISRLSLHAMKLKLIHPITDEKKEFVADIPKDMQAVIKALRKWDPLKPRSGRHLA